MNIASLGLIPRVLPKAHYGSSFSASEHTFQLKQSIYDQLKEIGALSFMNEKIQARRTTAVAKIGPFGRTLHHLDRMQSLRDGKLKRAQAVDPGITLESEFYPVSIGPRTEQFVLAEIFTVPDGSEFGRSVIVFSKDMQDFLTKKPEAEETLRAITKELMQG